MKVFFAEKKGMVYFGVAILTIFLMILQNIPVSAQDISTETPRGTLIATETVVPTETIIPSESSSKTLISTETLMSTFTINPCTSGELRNVNLDGVTISVCVPFIPDYSTMAGETDLVQSGSFIKQDSFQQLIIYPVPYGLVPASSELPKAVIGISSDYIQISKELFAQEGGKVVGIKQISIFGQQIDGNVAIIPLNNVNEGNSQFIAEWVLEAGGRVWIIRYLENGDFSSQNKISGVMDKLNILLIESDSLANSSISLKLSAVDTQSTIYNDLPEISILSDLPFPSWWNGDCNVNNHPGSYPLGPSYRGVKACGPLNTLVLVNFGVGVSQYEWQCTELVKRYLYLAFGIAPFSANGNAIVNNCPSNSNLEKVTNGTANKGPIAGDVISYNGPTSYGHTAIVSSSNINSSGNGSITVVEQNYNSAGTRTQSVSNWIVQTSDGASGWLHQTQFNGSSCSAPSNPNPPDGYISTSQTINFSWSAVSSCTFDGYTFRIKDVNTMDSGGNTLVDTGNSLTTRTETISSSWNNRDLYWGVKAANAPNGSNWSVQRFRIQPGSAPSQPSNPGPGDYSTLGRTNNTNLTWNTDGSSCTVHIVGGSINISPSGGCSSLYLGQQRGGTYTWQVTASNSYGNSTGPTWHFNIKPYGPTNLNSSVVSSSQINLSWTLSSDDESTNIDGYDIYNNNQLVGSVNKGISSYQATGLACNTTQSYFVKSKRQGIQSDASNTVTTTTAACGPAVPTLNSPANNASLPRTTNVGFSWNTASGATQYRVHFWGGPSVDSRTNWTTGTSITIGVQWGGSYQWNVEASNGSVISYSETRTLIVQYGNPTNLSASVISASQNNLSWNASADGPGNIDGYRIYRNGSAVSTVGSSTTTFQDTGLSCETTYSYLVRAYKGSVESLDSNTANATTSSCPARSDLSIQSITVENTSPYYTNADVWITVVFQNTSNVDSPAFYVNMFVDDAPTGCGDWGQYYARSNGIPANSTQAWRTQIPASTLTEGIHQFGAYADMDCEVTENNETNNFSSISFTMVTPPPAPTNDDFGFPRTLLTLPYSDSIDVSGATRATDDPDLTGCNRAGGTVSVWYKYNSSTSGSVSLDTYGSNYDTMIGVWSGAQGGLTEVTCNDDSGGVLQSAVTFIANTGTNYYIGVSQYSGSIAGIEASEVGGKAEPEEANQLGRSLVLNGTTFTDVPGNHPFWRYIEGFYAEGITTGCSTNPMNYCPDNSVTRSAMAVFLLRAMNGTDYQPPAATGIFTDLPVAGKEWMQPWVEEFYREGITTGCSAYPLQYCPENSVTRASMAVFLLRAKYGANYQPPAATGIFADLPVTGKEWMEPWVEQFYREGITTGCGVDPLRYCPEDPVKRQAMAVFIDRAFGIPQLP